MKTPREILLKRHEGATPKLDAIRQEVLTTQFETQRAGEAVQCPFNLVALLMKPWQELIWPARRIWVGMAAVWIVILAVNLANGSDTSTITLAKSKTPPTPEVLAELREQHLLLAQLLGATAPVSPADRPKNSPPRSEREEAFQIV